MEVRPAYLDVQTHVYVFCSMKAKVHMECLGELRTNTL